MRNTDIAHTTIIYEPISNFLKNLEFSLRNCIPFKNGSYFLCRYGRNKTKHSALFVKGDKMCQFRRNGIIFRIIRKIRNCAIRHFGVAVCSKSQFTAHLVAITLDQKCNSHGRGHVLRRHTDFFVQIFISGIVFFISALFFDCNRIICTSGFSGNFCTLRSSFFDRHRFIIILADFISLRK